MALAQIAGGEVNAECSSVAGDALCFGGAGTRFGATAPVNTIGGGVLRFSLHLLRNDGVPADVMVEFKAIGRGWEPMQHYSADTYDAPAYSNPNGASLALWEGGGRNGFVLYAVQMPAGAQSAATKFRWRQARDFVTGHVARWAIDDVSLDVDVLNPAVQVTGNVRLTFRPEKVVLDLYTRWYGPR